ncbi:MAG TPA: MnmC family methyltransferase [Coleofasciculaceae cyanobacterium]|jgi:tRNA U34 5-methylaminomethyl-2-thiouridine-forming methyltransferase MnmC
MAKHPIAWIPQPTQDGSFTFFSPEFGETFHSREGAKAEAFLKFAAATDLVARSPQASLRLLDVCYGLGYNTAAALETIWAANPNCRIELHGLELDATVPQAAIALLESWSPRVQEALKAIAQDHHYQTPQLQAKLWIGDARQTIQQLAGFEADAIFFDPFSPRCCPQLWTVEFLHQVSRRLSPDGKLATYSRAAAVRSALLEVGLKIGTIPIGGDALNNPISDRPLSHEWSQGTVASFNGDRLCPLSQLEQEHLQTRASVPYRDANLSDTAEVILAQHQQEQEQCQKESTSSWRRRWGIW